MVSHVAPPPVCTMIQPSSHAIGCPKLLPDARRRGCVAPMNGYIVCVAIIVEATHSVIDTSMCCPSPVLPCMNSAMAAAAAPFSPPSYCAWNPPCFRGSRSCRPLMLMISPMA